MFKMMVGLLLLWLLSIVVSKTDGIGRCRKSNIFSNKPITLYRQSYMIVCSAELCCIYRYSDIKSVYGGMFMNTDDNIGGCRGSFIAPQTPGGESPGPINNSSENGKPSEPGDLAGHRDRRDICSPGPDGDSCCPTQLDVLWFNGDDVSQTNANGEECEVIQLGQLSQATVVGSCQNPGSSCNSSGTCYLSNGRYVFLLAICPDTSPYIGIYLFEFGSHCICLNAGG